MKRTMGMFGIDIGNVSVIPTDILEIHFGQGSHVPLSVHVCQIVIMEDDNSMIILTLFCKQVYLIHYARYYEILKTFS